MTIHPHRRTFLTGSAVLATAAVAGPALLGAAPAAAATETPHGDVVTPGDPRYSNLTTGKRSPWSPAPGS